MGGYDLYGNYYSRTQDALNAETAQCNQIDNEILKKETKDSIFKIERLIAENKHLNDRIEELEKKLKEKGGTQC